MIKASRCLKNNKGFTFVELIVAMLLLTIITSSVATVLAPTLKAYNYANDIAEMNTLLDNIANELTVELDNAIDVEFDSSDGVLTVTTNSKSVNYTVNSDGYLVRNGKLLLDTSYYKNKTINISYSAVNDDKAFYITIDIIDNSVIIMSRDYAVKPLGLNQY